MELERVFSSPRTLSKLQSGPVGMHLDGFCAWLLRRGYSRHTIRLHLVNVSHLNEHLKGKFRKARWVPLSASTCSALQSYLDRRSRIKPHSPDSPLFLNLRSRRLHYCTVNQTFHRLLTQCQISHSEPAVPKIHSLRHTFAVHRLLAWYRDGKDVNARLPWLATYMGHVDICSTQVYLQAIYKGFNYW